MARIIEPITSVEISNLEWADIRIIELFLRGNELGTHIVARWLSAHAVVPVKVVGNRLAIAPTDVHSLQSYSHAD
jgi:hypothetical protein